MLPFLFILAHSFSSWIHTTVLVFYHSTKFLLDIPPLPQSQLCQNWVSLKNYHLLCTYVQFSSVAQSCPTLCDPMNHSTPGLPVHHQLPEFTQTHVHWIGDAIQPSHPLLSHSPPAPNSSQHQGLFQWVNLLMRWPKYWSFSLSISPSRWSPLGWTDLIFLQSKGLSRGFSNTTVQKHQFFSAQPSLWSNSHIHMWLL